MDKQIVELYAVYTAETINRRDFLKKLSVLAGGAAAAWALLPELEKSRAEAQQIPADDARINKGIDAYQAALEAARVDYQIYIYEGAKHAFNNDTNPQRYHPDAAALAWQRTLAFFNERLKPAG